MPHIGGALDTLAELIEGHTDNLPISTLEYASNWQLSAARGANVVYFLTRQIGVPAGQLSIGAYADQRPVDTNETSDGRQRNRRVDIVFGKGQWRTLGKKAAISEILEAGR